MILPKRSGQMVKMLANKSGNGEFKSAVGWKLLYIELTVQSSKSFINLSWPLRNVFNPWTPMQKNNVGAHRGRFDP